MLWKTKYTSSVLRHSLWVIASLTFPILSDKSHKKWNIRKYMEKYSVHIRGNMHCIFGDMFITYLGAALSDQGWGGHWGPDFLWDAWSGRAIQGQTVGDKETLTFCHSDKYISQFWQIHFPIWTNIFWSRLGPDSLWDFLGRAEQYKDRQWGQKRQESGRTVDSRPKGIDIGMTRMKIRPPRWIVAIHGLTNGYLYLWEPLK